MLNLKVNTFAGGQGIWLKCLPEEAVKVLTPVSISRGGMESMPPTLQCPFFGS
jgi:hypothetical protein